MTELPSVDEALQYADGYLEGLKDRADTDVADLIMKINALECELSFQKASAVVARKKVIEECAEHLRNVRWSMTREECLGPGVLAMERAVDEVRALHSNAAEDA